MMPKAAQGKEKRMERCESSMTARVATVRERIAKAAARAGRNPEDIVLVAVSKTVDVPAIRDAMALGLSDFGESRVQEYLRKTALTDGAGLWHFIGRLQTNKVRQLAGRDVLIHSLDRMELLEEMVRVSKRTGCRWRALIEVNVSGEASKAGVDPDALEPLVRAASGSGCVEVLGLMTVAPYEADPEMVRCHFHDLRQKAIDIHSLGLDNVVMRHLSMGMSGDLEIAVEEGATLVRVGTAIFGDRGA